jgi:hypothetical protein
LNFGPIKFPSPVWKRRWRHLQLAALYRLDPSRVLKPKAARAFDKAVSLVVKRLNGFPIV